MSQSNALPSLFGRFTAILKDHEHLAKTLRRLRLMCASLDNGHVLLPEDLDPRVLMTALCVDLAEHFRAEESPSYFGIVMSEAPALSRQVAGLKWEHLTMLRAAEVLRELGGDQTRWRELPSPTRELISLLERHERSESALLRGLFQADG